VLCASAYYSFSVLVSTFLDDVWQMGAGMISLVLSMWLFNTQPVPFHAIGSSSPLITHTLPWSAMGASVAIACVLLAASWRVVESAEY
jgi:hypothetical protein